jgi:hypothetical protein
MIATASVRAKLGFIAPSSIEPNRTRLPFGRSTFLRRPLPWPLLRGNRADDQLASSVNRKRPIRSSDRGSDERLDVWM